MCKKCKLWAFMACINIISAASIKVPVVPIPVPVSLSSQSTSPHTTTSAKPSTLLLPSGFDPQLPPRQPMLYPFVVPSSVKPSPPTLQSIGPFITPGWIPISSSNIKDIPQYSSSSTTTTTTTSTTTTTPRPYIPPVLEDRISKYILESNENGPVFESIVYGTWKPDPPLQPVGLQNGTTTKTSMFIRPQQAAAVTTDDNTGGIIDNDASDGKVFNKTINRQHGGFIDNKQQNPIKFENDAQDKTTSTLPLLEQKSSKESKGGVEQKPSSFRKAIKKQGRQKIRPKSKVTNALSATTDTATTATATTATSKATSHQAYIPTIDSTEPSSTTIEDVIKVNTNVPMEVVRQINDSIEIKYNHKQTSRHSIEMTAAHERYNNHRSEDNEDIDDHGNAGDEDDYVELVTKTLTDSKNDNAQLQEDEDISVIRMNWPTDFMEVQVASNNLTEQASEEEYDNESSSQTAHTNSDESESSELPMALSALNIPPSLWPKLPGNITKLGTPYASQGSLEEPAICVPITVREFNMMNSNEVVNIERVFCFPMPSGITMAKETMKSTTTTTRSSSHRGRGTSSPVIRASIQNYEEYFETHPTNGSTVWRPSSIHILCYLLAFVLKLFQKSHYK
ncbi:putative mediator of RNA polymerase II transcription subunit 24 [Stomoxys calcitrans]|uniref:putative mediator of RNA polymerase II transcription subunit 24 n=1 Tax=Stomoxys calcitrans TaxID=35570 RepID=UPI0027E39E58|nr:putative mediator of RNA polymerase II transcription subunit 24 [Stomoxys calcitrans]